MTHPNPIERPTINQVVSRFQDIERQLSSGWFKLRAPIREQNATEWFERAPRWAIYHWPRQLFYVLGRYPAMPKPNPKP